MVQFSLGVYIVFGCLSGITGNKYDVEEIYFWREVLYENLPYSDDVYIGKYPYYIPENNDIIGLGFHAQSGLMVATVGRMRPGVPSNLNAFCVEENYRESSPYLWGFPNYEINTLEDSFYRVGGVDIRNTRMMQKSRKMNYSAGYYKHFHDFHSRRYPGTSPWDAVTEDYSIIAVHRPCIDDQCSRLFALDTGILHYGPHEAYNVQNPVILVYSLPVNGCNTRNFPLIRRVVIPKYLWQIALGFLYVTLDYQPKGTCDDVLLYITNAYDNRIIVYDYKRGNFWYLEDQSMKPIISESSMVFGKNHHYDLPLGIINIALGWPDKNGNKNAYYAPGASIGEYVVSTKILKNPKQASSGSNSEITLIGYRKCNSQTFRQVFDPFTGVIFFGEMQSRKLRCWNTRNPLNPDTVGIVYESNDIDFISEVFLDRDGYLWFHSSQAPVSTLTDIPLDLTHINSRTFRVNTSEAIKGTVCNVSNQA